MTHRIFSEQQSHSVATSLLQPLIFGSFGARTIVQLSNSIKPLPHPSTVLKAADNQAAAASAEEPHEQPINPCNLKLSYAKEHRARFKEVLSPRVVPSKCTHLPLKIDPVLFLKSLKTILQRKDGVGEIPVDKFFLIGSAGVNIIKPCPYNDVDLFITREIRIEASHFTHFRPGDLQQYFEGIVERIFKQTLFKIEEALLEEYASSYHKDPLLKILSKEDLFKKMWFTYVTKKDRRNDPIFALTEQAGNRYMLCCLGGVFDLKASVDIVVCNQGMPLYVIRGLKAPSCFEKDDIRFSLDALISGGTFNHPVEMQSIAHPIERVIHCIKENIITSDTFDGSTFFKLIDNITFRKSSAKLDLILSIFSNMTLQMNEEEFLIRLQKSFAPYLEKHPIGIIVALTTVCQICQNTEMLHLHSMVESLFPEYLKPFSKMVINYEHIPFFHQWIKTSMLLSASSVMRDSECGFLDIQYKGSKEKFGYILPQQNLRQFIHFFTTLSVFQKAHPEISLVDINNNTLPELALKPETMTESGLINFMISRMCDLLSMSDKRILAEFLLFRMPELFFKSSLRKTLAQQYSTPEICVSPITGLKLIEATIDELVVPITHEQLELLSNSATSLEPAAPFRIINILFQNREIIEDTCIISLAEILKVTSLKKFNEEITRTLQLIRQAHNPIFDAIGIKLLWILRALGNKDREIIFCLFDLLPGSILCAKDKQEIQNQLIQAQRLLELDFKEVSLFDLEWEDKNEFPRHLLDRLCEKSLNFLPFAIQAWMAMDERNQFKCNEDRAKIALRILQDESIQKHDSKLFLQLCENKAIFDNYPNMKMLAFIQHLKIAFHEHSNDENSLFSHVDLILERIQSKEIIDSQSVDFLFHLTCSLIKLSTNRATFEKAQLLLSMLSKYNAAHPQKMQAYAYILEKAIKTFPEQLFNVLQQTISEGCFDDIAFNEASNHYLPAYLCSFTEDDDKKIAFRIAYLFKNMGYAPKITNTDLESAIEGLVFHLLSIQDESEFRKCFEDLHTLIPTMNLRYYLLSQRLQKYTENFDWAEIARFITIKDLSSYLVPDENQFYSQYILLINNVVQFTKQLCKEEAASSQIIEFYKQGLNLLTIVKDNLAKDDFHLLYDLSQFWLNLPTSPDHLKLASITFNLLTLYRKTKTVVFFPELFPYYFGGCIKCREPSVLLFARQKLKELAQSNVEFGTPLVESYSMLIQYCSKKGPPIISDDIFTEALSFKVFNQNVKPTTFGLTYGCALHGLIVANRLDPSNKSIVKRIQKRISQLDTNPLFKELINHPDCASVEMLYNAIISHANVFGHLKKYSSFWNMAKVLLETLAQTKDQTRFDEVVAVIFLLCKELENSPTLNECIKILEILQIAEEINLFENNLSHKVVAYSNVFEIIFNVIKPIIEKQGAEVDLIDNKKVLQQILTLILSLEKMDIPPAILFQNNFSMPFFIIDFLGYLALFDQNHLKHIILLINHWFEIDDISPVPQQSRAGLILRAILAIQHFHGRSLYVNSSYLTDLFTAAKKVVSSGLINDSETTKMMCCFFEISMTIYMSQRQNSNHELLIDLLKNFNTTHKTQQKDFLKKAIENACSRFEDPELSIQLFGIAIKNQLFSKKEDGEFLANFSESIKMHKKCEKLTYQIDFENREKIQDLASLQKFRDLLYYLLAILKRRQVTPVMGSHHEYIMNHFLLNAFIASDLSNQLMRLASEITNMPPEFIEEIQLLISKSNEYIKSLEALMKRSESELDFETIKLTVVEMNNAHFYFILRLTCLIHPMSHFKLIDTKGPAKLSLEFLSRIETNLIVALDEFVQKMT